MKVGQIYKNLNGSYDKEFSGYISTMNVQIEFYMSRVAIKSSENAPDYEICAKTKGDYMPKIGAAWEKIIQRGAKTGEPFLSISIDDPSMEKPLSASAFKVSDGTWDIIWSRPRGDKRPYQKPVQQEQAANQQVTGDESTEIPFP